MFTHATRIDICFKFSAMINKDAMRIHEKVFGLIKEFISWVKPMARIAGS